MTRTKKLDSKLEGEGNYSAAKVYDDATRDFITKGKVSAAAAEAKRAVDSSDGAGTGTDRSPGQGSCGAGKGHEIKALEKVF
jgi:hypothetical protein